MNPIPAYARSLGVGALLAVLTSALGGSTAVRAAQDRGEEEQGSGEQASEEATPPPRFEERIHVEGTLEAVPTIDSPFAKFPVSFQSTPASLSVVPRFVLETQDANVLGDALRNVSGVNVATGFGVFDFFVLRAFDSLYTSPVT